MSTLNTEETRRAIVAMAESDKSMRGFADKLGIEKVHPDYFFAVREALSDLSNGRCGFNDAARRLNKFH